jgi:predicted phage gp36 major capsid-like protein
MQKRATDLAETLAGVAKNLRAANTAVASETFKPLLAQLVEAMGLTEHSTRDAEKAVSEGVALHTKTGVLVPIDFKAKALRRAA